MEMTTSEFCEALARQFPDLAKLLVDHIADNDKLLPHVFLADVTRYVLADGTDRRAIVQYLNDAFKSKGTDVENLIAVSFVEYLVNPEEFERATKGLVVPQIHEEWERQRE